MTYRKKHIITSLTLFCFVMTAYIMIESLSAFGEEHDRENTASSSTHHERSVIVYYFHGTYRCPSCTTIEQLTEFAVTEGFKEELQDGRLEFKAINIESPETKHFIEDYTLYTKSVIVSEVVDGKERKWKNLEKIWQLFMKEKVFTEYIQQEVSVYLAEAEDKEQKE